MTWNIRKILLGTALSLIVLLVCFGLGLLPLNLFFLKTTITEAVREHTGAELVIEGPLRVQLGMQPKLTAGEVLVRWPDETGPLSASVRDIAIQTRLSSIWRGDIDLQGATAQGFVINEGSGYFGEWLPEQLRLEAAAPLNEDIILALRGRVRGENWAVSLNGASLDYLLNATKDYPLSVSLDLPRTGLEFNGAVLLPWDTPRVTGQLDVLSRDLSSLLSHLGQEVPGLGQLSLHSGIELDRSMVELDRLEGTLDDFSFTLTASASDWSTRPWFEITANIAAIYPASLPGMKRGSADSEPGTPLDLQPLFDQLKEFNGRAELTVGQVYHADFPVKDLSVSTSLEEGLLTISNATASISGIDVSAQASLDTSAACARLETSVWVPEIDLATLADLAQQDVKLEGRLENGRLKTVSCGVVARKHLQKLETTLEVDTLMLSDVDDQPPLEFNDIDVAVNWQEAGRISFDSVFLGEPLTLAAEFGSVEQLLSDEFWPIALEARTATVELELAGQTAVDETGLTLDLTLAARLGNSDVSGELDWSGIDSGRPLKADLQSTLLDLEDLEMLFSNNGPDDSGSIQNWSELLDNAELLEHWHQVPSIDVRLAVERLDGTSYEINSIGLNAHLEDRQLKGGQMQLDFEGVEMKGLINVDMSEPLSLFDYQAVLKNVDIGRLMKATELSDTVDARVEQADIRFESQGETPRELIQNMKIDMVLRSLQWSFEAGPRNRPFDMDLSELKVHILPGVDTIWQTRGTLNGFPLNAWLKTPNLRVAFDENLPLPLRLIVGSRSDTTMLDLVVYPEPEGSLRTKIQLSGRYTNDEYVDFSTLPSPLEDYSFSTNLAFRKNEYLASDIEINLGSSDATGTFSIQPSGQGYLFNLGVNSSLIETDDFVLWVQEFRKTRDFMNTPEVADPEEAPKSESMVTMIDQYFDEFIGDNTWDVDVNVSELRSGGNLLGETQFSLHMDGDEFILDPATISLPGGNVSIKYSSIEDNSYWDYNLDIYIEQLEYAGLLRLFDPETTASGEIHVNTALRSRSDNVEDVVNHLEGTVDLAVFPDDVGAQFLDLWASNLVIALLPTGDNQQKKLNCMVARFEVENGVMKSKETFLDSTEIIVRARGEIDLANRQLDLLAAPQAKTEKFLSVSTPIEVTGPFDDFLVGVATGGFVKTLLRWYLGLIYVPWKWLTGERFPPDGIETCYRAMDWAVPTEAR